MGNTHRFLWHRCAVRCGTKRHLEEFIRVGNGLLHVLPEVRVIAGVQDGSTHSPTHKEDTCTNDFAYGNTGGGKKE